MNFRTFDLNLLRVFEAVMLEGKLTRAAEVLAMSQPAVSNALARLRDALNDPLFIREGYGVKPSLRALQLWPSIEAALAQLRQTLEPDQSFDPRQCNETITLAMADSTATLLIPALMRKTRQEAPGLSWRVRTLFSRDPRELLASAELDLALGYFPAVEAEAISTQADQSHAADAFRSRRLYEGEYVCVMRPDHPLAGVNLDLERYCAAEHLLVSFSGRPHGFVDEALEADLLEEGQPVQALLQRRLEVLPIVFEQLEAERVRHGVDEPGLRHGLERAEPDLVVDGEVVRAAVGVARARVHVDVARDRVRVDVVVLDRGERHVDAVRAGEVARPHAAGEHDLLGLDLGAVDEDDAGGAPVDDAQPGRRRPG